MPVLMMVSLFATSAMAADLDVTVSTARVELGGAVPKVTVEVKGPNDLSAVQLSANHGRLGPVIQVSPGRFSAEFIPPSQTYPRVALISATGVTAAGVQHGWARLPLWGRAEAQLRTRPNADVSVRIGDQTYGPVRADARGKGSVMVLVPPGIQTGYYGKKTLDLGLPRVALTHLALDRSDVTADGEAKTVGVRLYAVTDQGAPRSGLQIRARASTGSLSEFVAQAPGVYVASWSFTAAQPGETDLSAWASSEPNATAQAKLMLRPGAPVRVTLEADPPTLVAGVSRDAVLSIRAFDARGNPTSGAPQLTATLGSIGKPREVAEGVWTAELFVGDHFNDDALTATAQVGSASPATAKVQLKPGPPQVLQVQPETLTLERDPSSVATLSVVLKDRFGNRIDAPPAVASNEGDTVIVDDAHVQYRPRRSLADGSDVIELSAAQQSAKVQVTLEGAAPRFTLAPKVGFLTNLGNAHAFVASLELLGWVASWLGLGIEPGYGFTPYDSAEVSVRIHQVPVLAVIAARAKLGRLFRFQANASGGVVVSRSVLTLTDQSPVSEGALAPAAQLALDLGLPIRAGALFLEVALRWVGDPRGNNLSGSLFSVGASLGYRFDVR